MGQEGTSSHGSNPPAKRGIGQAPKNQTTIAAYLSYLATESNAKFLPNPYQDLDADQTERAILFESVPRCDLNCTVLSPDPVRGLVLLHMGIGEGSGQLITRGEKRGGKSKEGEGEKVREVDVRSELLGEIVGLSQEMMNWMDSKKGQPMPRNLKSTDIRKLGAERPTETQVYKHYVMMREYFKTYILDDLGTFLRLQQNEHYQKALCDVMSWLYSDDCGGCMNYRLQQSFSRRIIEHESAALAAAATSSSSLDIPQPKKKDLTLTKDEFLCLNSLHFAIPQHVDGLKPMLPYIAARIDPDDVVDGHSIQCRELHSLPLTLGSMYTFMWESCPGGIAILEAGGIDQIGRLDVYDNTKISGIDTSIAHEFQERMEKEKSEEIDDDDSDGSVDEEELSPSSLHKSSLIQAHDIITSKTKESMDAILKTPPLDWIWMVQLTDRALGTFRRMKRKNLRNFVPVMKNIDMIARGFWTDSTACSLVADTKVVLYESKVLNNLRIVWQVEVAYLEINRMHSQVIRIHSIGNHKDVVNAVEYIQAAQRAYSKTRIDRCKERPKDNRGFVTPLTWRDDGDDSKHIVEFSREDMENPLKVLKMHEQAVTAKFFPLSKMMLCWLIDGAKDNEETEFPFSVSEQEDEILNHRNSVIVVGRSGTGKTSCSVFRLLSNWHARRVDFKQGGHIANSVGMNPLFLLEDGESKKPRFRFRQIFVTASPKFCGRVQAYYQTLSKSLNPGGDEHVLAELIDMINKPDDEGATNIIHEFGQDESLTVEEELAKMDSGDDVTTSSPKSPDEFWDKEEDYIQRLPKSFGDLKDSDFPLFVHYKKLLSMIRVYLGLEEDVTFAEGEAAERNADFERFKEIYHSLDRNLILGMDASLVFSEIMGVIKGSEMAAVSAEGKLSREEYCNLSTRAHATFKETRDQIYDIFEAYNQKKLERFQAYVNGKLEFLEVPRKLDEQDRVNEVNRLIAKMTAEKDPRLAAVMFNQVYLDEVQDLTMAQILPLVTLCSDPNHGLMFAGDTAQVIHRGSVFRFEDLSAMIYNTLKPMKAITEAPRIFKLTKNYRSHDGILGVAASVLDILRDHFPTAIDKLPAEKGTIAGPQPVLVIQKNNSTSDILSFLSGGKAEGEPIEFGAGQVILVRTLENVAEVKRLLKDNFALVMTVEQAKGMEFRDVVLMNLITDSPGEAQLWRLFLKNVPGNTEPCPSFDSKKHNILATELKILYTAITRARSQLWIWDSDEKKRYPLFKFWQSMDLAVTSDDARSGKFTAKGDSTTVEEWIRQGQILFENKNYEDALKSFRRGLRQAGKPESEQSVDTLRCEAYIKREMARALPKDRLAEAKSLYFEAAELLKRAHALGALSQGQIAEAARCYWESDKYSKAAEMYELVKHKDMDAVRCFRKVSKWKEAGNALVEMESYKDALEVYLKTTACSVEALKTIKILFSRNEAPDSSTIEKVSTMALANHHLSKKEKVDAIEINPDVGVRKGLYRSHAMFSELAKLFETQNDFEGAARVMDLDAGKPLEAVSYFKKISGISGNVKALECLSRFFWIRVTPSLAALWKGDIDSYRSTSMIQEFGSNGVVTKTLRPLVLVKGKLKGSDAIILQNKWIEVMAIDQFVTSRRVAVPLVEAVDLCELLSGLKLTLASQLLQLNASNRKSKPLDDILALKTLAENSLHLVLVLRTLFAGLNDAKLPITVLEYSAPMIPSLFSRIVDLSKISVREVLHDQVERSFYVTIGTLQSERICYKGVFEPNSVDLEVKEKKLVQQVRIDTSTGRFFCDVQVFDIFARTSFSFTIFNMCQSLVTTFLSSEGLGDMCAQAMFNLGKCSNLTCAQTHLVSSAEFDSHKATAMVHLVRVLVQSSVFIHPSHRSSFGLIQTTAMKRFVSSLQPWDNGHIWTVGYVDREIPLDVMDAALWYLKKKTFSLQELTNRSGGFDLDSVLGGSLILPTHHHDFLTASFRAANTTITQKPSGIAQNFVSKMLKLIHQCAQATTVVDFVGPAREILIEYPKHRSSLFKLQNLDGLCHLVEILTTIFLVAREQPFVLPWRIFRAGVARINGLLKNSIEPGLLAHFDSIGGLISEVLESLKTVSFHESKVLRLANSYMLFTQHKNVAVPRTGIPLWLTAPTSLKLLEKISVAGSNDLIFIFKGPLKVTDFVRRAVDVSRKQLLLTSGESRDIVSLKAAIKDMNEKSLLAGKTSVPRKEDSGSDSDEMKCSKSDSDSGPPANKSRQNNKSTKSPNDADDSDVGDMPELVSDSDDLADDYNRSQKTHVDHVNASLKGRTESQLYMADCYLKGTIEKRDTKKAIELLELLDKKGIDEATRKLGDFFFIGGKNGSDKNLNLAVKYYEKLAKKGKDDAKLLMAECYLRGDGVKFPININKAKECVEDGARKGNAKFQFLLGDILLKNEGGLKKNETEAVKWFTLAANQKHVPAMSQLAACFSSGKGVAKDVQQAKRYFQMVVDAKATDKTSENEAIYKEAANELAKLKSLNDKPVRPPVSDSDEMPGLLSDSDSDAPAVRKPQTPAAFTKTATASASTSKKQVTSDSDSDDMPELVGSTDESDAPPIKNKPQQPAKGATKPTPSAAKKTPIATSSNSKKATPTMKDEDSDEMPALVGSSDSDVPMPRNSAPLPNKNQKPVVPSSSKGKGSPQKPNNSVDEEDDEAVFAKRLKNVKPVTLKLHTDFGSESKAASLATKTKAVYAIESWWMKRKEQRTTSINRMPRIYNALRFWPKSRRSYLNVYIDQALPLYLDLQSLFPSLNELCQSKSQSGGLNEVEMKFYYDAIQLRENAISTLTVLDPTNNRHQIDTPQALSQFVREQLPLLQSIKRAIAEAPKSFVTKPTTSNGGTSNAGTSNSGTSPGNSGTGSGNSAGNTHAAASSPKASTSKKFIPPKQRKRQR